MMVVEVRLIMQGCIRAVPFRKRKEVMEVRVTRVETKRTHPHSLTKAVAS
jgi:hypothetical protein